MRTSITVAAPVAALSLMLAATWLPVAAATSLLLAAASRPAHAQDPAAAAPETLARVVTLPEIVVSTARADARTPVARSVLGREDLQQLNWGQDTPMALATLPGAYAYSDAGNGIGYSYLSIRGFPQRRISVLINGVPLNDPQSHEVYWIDHPDLLASTQEVQLQRGVGSALYGAASVGGSVNIETSPFGEVRRTAAAFSYGSFDTRRLMLEMDSGRLAGGWNLYGRYSRIETDGYRDQSWSRLWSYALSARRLTGNHALRVNLYGGPEETHLAYLGVSSDYLEGRITGDRDRDRRFNPLTYPGEADHFFEPHYELIHSWSPRPELAFTHTLFYFDGEGFYDERRIARPLANYRLSPWRTFDATLFAADSLYYYLDADGDGVLDRDADGRVTVASLDLVRRRWIRNRHYGWIPRARIEIPRGSLTLGGEIRLHDGHHVGTVLGGQGIPPGTQPDHVYYDFHPRTRSGGLFLRAEWRPAARLQVTGDLAWRHQLYLMRGDRPDPVFHPRGISFEQWYDFVIPRLGLTWTPREELTAFAAWSYASREPAFRDLYEGEGAGSIPLFRGALAGIFDEPLIRPERVRDYEAGAAWRRGRVALSANLFRMDFRDELIAAGPYDFDLGYPIIGNAARTVHQGVELAARLERVGGRGPGVKLDANVTLSDNHIARYRSESYVARYRGLGVTSPGDTLVLDGNRLGFFPSAIGNLAARLDWKGARLGADVQSVGRIYLDNTESMEGSVRPRTVLNFSGGYRLTRPETPAVELSMRVFNVLNRRYEAGGYSYFYAGTRYTDYIPAATRHALAEVRVEF